MSEFISTPGKLEIDSRTIFTTAIRMTRWIPDSPEWSIYAGQAMALAEETAFQRAVVQLITTMSIVDMRTALMDIQEHVRLFNQAANETETPMNPAVPGVALLAVLCTQKESQLSSQA